MKFQYWRKRYIFRGWYTWPKS